ncbi:hypothetical protein MDOR_02770 [Mycolicibacterium doricum]|uniref:Uncharacterized protein n=1 Tax=Mycolicibacterium doricum TaxID=126673 RepID=A0A7I7VRH6_9MYCO|nr:hypothetical protein MDOR_02770 [Mycolicibacterium doricum]
MHFADPREAAPTPEPTPGTEAEPRSPSEPQPEAAGAESASAQRRSPCPAQAFVSGAGVTNATVLAALLARAKIRSITHPGDAPPEPRYRPSRALREFVRCRDVTCRFPCG